MEYSMRVNSRSRSHFDEDLEENESLNLVK